MNSIAATPKTIPEDSPGVKLIPPTVFFVCLAVGGVLEFMFPWELPFVSFEARLLFGSLLGLGGFIFMGSANSLFKNIGTNVPTFLPAAQLVDSGAYGLSRNPMYVGGSAFFLGIGLAVGSLWLLLAYLPLWSYLTFFVIPREEAYMMRRFDEEYRRYCAKVRRWL